MRAWIVSARWVLHEGKFILHVPLPTDTILQVSTIRTSIQNNVDLNIQGSFQLQDFSHSQDLVKKPLPSSSISNLQYLS